LATLVLGNLLLFISFPFKFVSRIIFGNKPKTIVPEPVISKTVKAVAVSPDLQVEEAYIKKQDSNAYKKKADSIAFAKKTIEKQLKAIDISKKAISKPASVAIAPTIATVSPPIITESPAPNLSPIEIVNDIKDKVESAFDGVESFISGIKTDNDDEPAKGLVVSRLPIREAETVTETGSETVTDELTTASVESATAVVTKLYTEAAEEESLVTQQLNIEAASIAADVPTVAVPVVENVEVDVGPYDIYSVTVPDFGLVKSQVMQSLSERLASFNKAWKESVRSLESPNSSPGFADVMNVLTVKMEKKSVDVECIHRPPVYMHAQLSLFVSKTVFLLTCKKISPVCGLYLPAL